MKNRILAVALVLSVLLSLAACKGDAVQPSDAAQLQATETGITGETAKLSEEGTGVTGSEEKAPKESMEDLTEDSKATEESSSAPTEPATETTAPATQPTQPTQTTPTQPTAPPVTEPSHQHSYTATVIAPTCNDKGYTKHICSCGDSYCDTYTAALGHHYIDEVIAPTSTEKGYTKHTCDRCWYSYNDTYTDPVKQIYDTAQAQQIGNNYIASIGAVVTESLVCTDVVGYFPPEVVSGYAIGLVGGQEWLNNSAVENIQATVDRLIYMLPDGDITGVNMFCSVTYNAATDEYTICVYYA